MELRQYRRILTARQSFLKGIIIVDILAIIASAMLCEYVLDRNISLLTVLVFAIFTISLSIVYDMYRNACYRIFVNGDDIYIYYPTPSQRAGDEYIFYKILDLSLVQLTRSSIRFQGHMLVKAEGTKRKDINHIKDANAFFADVYDSDLTYTITKKFRVSRIYEDEHLLMELLKAKIKED